MKLLYFTKYSKKGASSRLRSIQFFPYFKDKGYVIKHSPLFSDSYLNALYNKKNLKNLIIIQCYIKRFFAIFFINKYDLIVIEKELFPYLPPIVELIFKRLGIKYIVDYDDAIFHNYDLSKNPYLKLISNKIDVVMKNSYYVFAGNSYLAKRASDAGAKNILILPTVIDTTKYNIIQNSDKSKFTLGWIGSPSTFKYIEELFPVFEKIKIKHLDFQVNIIGAKQKKEIYNDFINFIPWTEITEVEEINKFDIGIMPLHNTPWELGKCSYKLIQYMGCAKAILGSPVGMNNDVIIENFNGFIVKDNDWITSIEYCILNLKEVSNLGINGRKLVEKKYNLINNANQMNLIFKRITGK
ncbi:glycosyltransferase [Empedobacter sp.]|uniref:glycosyltransferase n=1 Tax=Empedobacter sp. TaxID=1927715 RepID=UPI0028A76F94|nr:glycosyltransferase [Empedobacter sp.]